MDVNFPADKPISITLTAAEWVGIRRFLGRAPHDEVAATLANMAAQMQAAATEEPKE